MIDIYILTDYKGYFGSKQKTEKYKSGMNLTLLSKYFKLYGFNTIYLSFTDIDFRKDNYRDKYVLYTSSEDKGYYYKDFIEDIVLGLELQGAILIPEYKFLRANNNKVFMEILRDLSGKESFYNIKSEYFGTFEKLTDKSDKISFPKVIKSSSGAMSKGVFLARNKKELFKKAKKISRTRHLFSELWDIKNYIKHKGNMILNSKYRNKFLIQNFIPNLKNDWKVLVYGGRFYTLYRKTRKNDFRASGSGMFYFQKEFPKGMLDFANEIIQSFGVPQLSIDIAYDGRKFILIELQALYFGTKTIENAPFYYVKNENSWGMVEEESVLEEVFAESISNYIKSRF